MSLTLATLRSRVSGAIGLSNVTGSSEQALIDGWLNEAVEQYLIETKCKVCDASLALTADEPNYTLPVSVLALQYAWIVPASGEPLVVLERMSTLDILNRRRYNTTGSWTTVYDLQGANLLLLDPAPAAGDVLHFYYIPAPTDMTATTDSPSDSGIPSNAHPAIEEYAKWKAADWDDDTSSQVGETYKKGWEEWIKKGRMRQNRMGGKWGPVRAGRRRQIPTSPGVDLGN